MGLALGRRVPDFRVTFEGCRFGVWGVALGFRVWGLGFRVWGPFKVMEALGTSGIRGYLQDVSRGTISLPLRLLEACL